MTDWTAFAGFAGVVVVCFLLLARASQSLVSHDDPMASRQDAPGIPTEPEAGQGPKSRTTEHGTDPPTSRGDDAGGDAEASADRALPVTRSLGTGELLANVLATHGLFALLVAAAAVYWRVPPAALGASGRALPAVAWGGLLGVALYVANEAGAAGVKGLGVDHDETLRELLAPSSPSGWVLLLVGVLPAIAVGEELLFRGVLVGAYATGLGLPPWGLALASSVAFALGHGAQGRGGVAVTGLLGFGLAAAFVLSGSLLLVVVAHYVVNALEFLVHEGLGVEWT